MNFLHALLISVWILDFLINRVSHINILLYRMSNDNFLIYQFDPQSKCKTFGVSFYLDMLLFIFMMF